MICGYSLFHRCSDPFTRLKVAMVIFVSRKLYFGEVPRELTSRHDCLLLGESMGKDIFRPLSELESVVGIEDQRLYERLGLLATRFPDGFEG